MCLEAGANDLGGTLMNESITRAAGGVHGQQLDGTACRRSRAASDDPPASAPPCMVSRGLRCASCPGIHPEMLRVATATRPPREQFGPTSCCDFALLAEQRGFDSVFISDHFQPWRHTDGHAPFSLAWLGALGARTSRIVMGTSVLTPTFRYQPADRCAGIRDARAHVSRIG